MPPQILITGAPGNVGSEVIAQLQAHQAQFAIGAYDVAAAERAFGTAADIRPFDFLRPATYAAAFAGIERLFLVRPPALADVPRQIAPAIQAAKAAGVRHIVFLSLQGVDNNRITPHYKIEQLIEGLGLDYTFLRASFFMQNLTTVHRAEIRDHSEIAVPVGKAKTSFIDVRDIAAVAALVLTHTGHNRQKYTLTGGEALDYQQVASAISAQLGREVRYRSPSLFSFVRQQTQNGQALGYALVVAALYTITRFGNASQVTDDVARLLQRPPISFAQFAHDYAALWQKQAA